MRDLCRLEWRVRGPDSAARAKPQTLRLTGTALAAKLKGMAKALASLTNPTGNGWWWRSHAFGAARWRGW